MLCCINFKFFVKRSETSQIAVSNLEEKNLHTHKKSLFRLKYSLIIQLIWPQLFCLFKFHIIVMVGIVNISGTLGVPVCSFKIDIFYHSVQ